MNRRTISKLIGRRVVAVLRQRFTTNTGTCWCLTGLKFDDGTVLRFDTLEHKEAACYGTDGVYPGRPYIAAEQEVTT